MINGNGAHTLGIPACGGQMTQEITGLSVCDAAPPFALRASDGQEIRLTDVLSGRAAILMFHRGTW